MTDSTITGFDPTRTGDSIDVPDNYRQAPTVVATLLNDAQVALRSDSSYAKSCVVRALDLLQAGLVPDACDPSLDPLGGLAGWQIRRAVMYIEANLASPIRVRDIAAQTCLSTSHFSRAFKRSLGQAPMTYVIRQRVQRAKRLLLTTQESMSQISLACGMCDQAHLTRVFRRVVGDSPMAWRRRHAAGPAHHPSK